LQGDTLLGEPFSLEQNNKLMRATLPAALQLMLPTPPALLHTLPCVCVVSGAILSLHARHEQQRFLFVSVVIGMRGR
jgi:hypothetical protein